MNHLSPPPMDLARFLQSLHKQQYAWADKLTLKQGEDLGRLARQQWAKGEQALTPEFLSMNPDTLQQHLGEIIKLLENNGVKQEVGPVDLQKAFFSEQADSFLAAAARWDEESLFQLSQEHNLNPETIITAVRQAQKPYLISGRQLLQELLKELEWQQAFCPTCGSEPAMARLAHDEYGKKYLHCTNCETQWGFKRIACPFCDNVDPYKLQMFYPEGNKRCRVEVCDQCQRYLKVVDEREGNDSSQPLNMLQEDLATLQLDVLAEQKGYKK